MKCSQEAQTSIPRIQDLCTVRTDYNKNLIWSASWAQMVWSMVMKPVNKLIRPTSKVHPHGARSWFYAQLLNSLLRASSLFSSTRIFYILFYAHLLYSLLRASSVFSSTRIFLILTLSKESHRTWSDKPQMKYESSKTPDNTPSPLGKLRSNSVWYNCHTAQGVSTD